MDVSVSQPLEQYSKWPHLCPLLIALHCTQWTHFHTKGQFKCLLIVWCVCMPFIFGVWNSEQSNCFAQITCYLRKIKAHECCTHLGLVSWFRWSQHRRFQRIIMVKCAGIVFGWFVAPCTFGCFYQSGFFAFLENYWHQIKIPFTIWVGITLNLSDIHGFLWS